MINDARRNPSEGDDDTIDRSIVDVVEIINKNPDLVTTGSCSGHGGWPFISVVFKDDKTQRHYTRKARGLGYSAFKSSDFRLGFFVHNKHIFKNPVVEEMNYGLKDPVDSCHAKATWDDFARIFSSW